MPFLTKIISGGPGLLIAFALCLIVIKARLINLPKPCSSTCSLFFRRCIFLLLQYSASIIRKRQFLDSPAGPSLPSAFYSSGDLPVVKSNRPDVFAFLSGSAKKAGFLLGIFVLLSFANASAATITSTRTGGNWNDPATWVGGTVPSTGDDVTITSGARVVIDSDAVVGTLTISGILQYDSSAAYTLTATEFITVNAEGVFRSAQSGAIKNHRLIAHGSIINNGTIDFSSNANETGVELVFTGPGNAIFNCSDAVLTNLRQENGITLNKGKSAASVLSFIPGRAFQVLSDGSSNAKGFLTIENGTFNVIGSKDFRNPVFGADGTFIIPATGGFWLGNQNAEITGQNGDIVIQGELKITNGIFNAGTSGGNSLKTEGNGNLKISGGVVNVAGKLHVDGGVFSISGGRLNLAILPNSANNEPTFEVSSKAKLEIFGNPLITITYPNSGQTLANDIQILEGRGSKFISGGVIQLGTEATPAQSIFLVSGERIIPYLTGFSECSTIAYNTSKADVATTQVAALPRIALDKTAPEITAPEKITIKCGETLPTAYASLSEFTKAGGMASDNCSLNPSGFRLVKEVRSKAICPYIVTRTYEIADASGNTATAEQQIQVEGNIAEPQAEPVSGEPIAQELKLKSAMAGAITAIANGNWNDPNTWDLGRIPASDDDVIIATAFAVTLNTVASCKTISLQSGGKLEISTNGSLTCTQNTNLIINPGSELLINGGYFKTEASIQNDGTFHLISGTAEVGTATGNELQTRTGGIFKMEGGTLNISGRLVNSAGEAYISEGVINLALLGQADSGTGTFHMSLTTDLSITGGSIILHNNSTAGSVPIDIKIYSGSGSKSITGGTFDLGSASTLSGSVFRVDSPIAFNNFRLNSPNAAMNIVGNNLTINNQLTMKGGNINTGTQSLILNGSLPTALSYSSGMVIGDLQRAVSQPDVDYVFPVGNANSSTLKLNFASIPSPGTVTASSDGILPSGFLLNSATVTGPVFITNTVGFTTVSGSYQLPTGFNSSQKVGLFNGTWSYQPATASVGFSGWNSLTNATFALADCTPPTITLGANPIVCSGATSANLAYSSTTGAPDGYRIDYDPAATAAGLNDIAIITALTASPIVLTIPSGIAAGTYNATLYVSNAADCESNGDNFQVSVNPVTAITSQSTAGQTKCLGGAFTPITVTAAGTAPITYQWYSNTTATTTGGTSLGSSNGAQTSSYTPQATTAGTLYYYCIVTGTCGTATSAASGAFITDPATTITSQSTAGQTQCLGGPFAAISVTATGTAPITYQWYSNTTATTTGGTSLGSSNGAQTSSYTPQATTAGTLYYYCIVTGTCGTATSAASGAFITDPATTITSQSTAGQTQCLGGTFAAISVTATGTAPITYQWYSNTTATTTGGTSLGSSNGAQTSSYTPQATTAGTLYYYCIVTGTCGTATSAASGAFITDPATTITSQSTAGQTQCIGGAFTSITVTASGTGVLTYQWYSNAVASTTGGTSLGASNGANTNSYTPQSTVAGTLYYYCVVTGSCGSVTSAVSGTFTINPIPTVSATPTTQTICPGSNFTIAVSNPNSVAGTTFSWTRDNTAILTGIGTNGSGTTITGVLNSSQPTTTQTTTFTITATANACSSLTTATVTVIDNTPPTFTPPAATTIFTNASCSFDKAPSQTGSPINLADNCTATASLIISYTDTATPTTFCSPGNTITRTWSVKDIAGNITTQNQTITVLDNIAPIITVPNDVTIQCGTNTSTLNTGGTASATDNCANSASITITYSDSTPIGNNCDRSFTRTWRATDPCGNSSTGVQYIQIMDTQKPTASISPITVHCAQDITNFHKPYTSLAQFLADGGTASDNCSTALSFAFWDEVAQGLEDESGYCPDALIRTYRITDECGNYKDVIQTITNLDDNNCKCSFCETNNSLEVIDLRGNPAGSITRTVRKQDKCCTATQKNDYCASFNVIIDEDAVGITIAITNPSPPGQDWKQDCKSIPGGSIVCLEPGKFHLFTFCKNGNGEPQQYNDYTFTSIQGVVASNDITTRVNCSGQINTEGVVSNPQWRSIWPGLPGAYNDYLYATSSSTVSGSGVNVADPYFKAPPGAPAEIHYEICGDIPGFTCVKNGATISRDCDTIAVYIKPEIKLSLSINTDLICQGYTPVLTPTISPAAPTGTYQLDWENPLHQITYNTANYTPTMEGTYTVTITDVLSGILCNTGTATFTVAYDKTGPNFTVTEPALRIECNEADYVNTINTWRSKFKATYLNAQGNTVTATVTDDFDFSKLNMVCGNVVTVTFTAPDQCTNYSTVTSTIKVEDNIKPTIIHCPADAQNYADNNLCQKTTLVMADPLTFTDNCGTPVLTWVKTGATTGSGVGQVTQPFNVGITTVTYTVTDACGNAVSCTQRVTIIDDQPPAITCPPDATETSTVNNCSKTLAAVTNPVITDNCSTATLTWTMTGATSGTGTGTVTGATFNVGVTTVTYTITDSAGNASSCSFKVTIKDVTPPSVGIGGCTDVAESVVGNGCSKIPVTLGDPVYNDNCYATASLTLTYTMTGATTGSGIGSVKGLTFNVGVTTVTYTVTDPDNNSANCSFSVTIKDVTPPSVGIGGCTNVSELVSGNGCSKIPVTLFDPTYSDNCYLTSSLTLTYTMTGATIGTGTGSVAGKTFNVGVTTVTYTVTDPDNNLASCSFSVTIHDVTPPNISVGCANVTDVITGGGCSMVTGTIQPPTLSDNCWGTSSLTLTYSMTGATLGSGVGSVAGLSFNAGITSVTYTVSDPDGNSASCTFSVTIIPFNPPQFSVGCPPSPAPVSVTGTNCNAFVNIPIPDIDDPCSVLYTLTNSFNGTNDASGIYAIGYTTVTWTITPTVGAVVTCTQIVTVNDLPLVCPGNTTTSTDFGQDYASNVPVAHPSFSSTCTGLTLTWQTVNSAGTFTNSATTGVNFVPSPGTFSVGVTTITYTLTHATGAVESCFFTITVLARPKIDCPDDIVANTDTGTCTYKENDPTKLTPTLVKGAQPITWSWTMTGATTASGTGNPLVPIPYEFNLGVTVINWTATNASGDASCSHTVTVTDKEAPTFTSVDKSFCVENISQAIFDSSIGDITPVRPDWYIVTAGSTELDISNVNDNCCVQSISWIINFSNGHTSISGTGQPSTYDPDNDGTPNPIKLWGNTDYTVATHTITYTVTDCNGNPPTVKTQQIVIEPRPNIIKMP